MKIILTICCFFSVFCCQAQNDDTVKISIGASFDFINKQSNTDLYFDLLGHKCDTLFGSKTGSRFLDRIGLDFKIYQTRTLSLPPDTTQTTLGPVRLRSLNPDEDLVGDISFSRAEKITFEELGLNINPTYKFSENFYALVFTEMLIKSISANVNFFDLDTANITTVAKGNYTTFPSNYQQKDRDIYVTFGLGAICKFNIYSVKLKIKPILSFTQYARQVPIIRRSTQGYNYHPSFTCDIQLLESKSGFKLGVMLRDFDLTAKDVDNLRSQPMLSLYLAKQFDINKLAEFLNSK